MSKLSTIQERLILWNPDYAERVHLLPKDNWKFHNAARWIAAELAKSGFGLNPASWARLEKIEEIFGKRLRKRVTYNLFNRK